MDRQERPGGDEGRERPLEPGDTVGKFVIEAKIGEGGFGVVYRARNDIDKVGAVKVLNRQFSADPDMVSRFKAEARAVNQIRHPNIIDIFEFGTLPDGRQYYIMEYLDGFPMDQYLADHGKLRLAEALPILRAIARALDAAHKAGIAHRDLKPENVFLVKTPEGSLDVRLLDFGIAKLLHRDGGLTAHKTRTGAPIGTPYYMSPEQCRGRDVDHRTDFYAFGCLLYQTLTGRYAFDGDDVMDILIAQTQKEAPPPSTIDPALSPFIDEAVAWLLKKDPKERPATALAAIELLEGALPPEHGWPQHTGKDSLSNSKMPKSVPAATADTMYATMPESPSRRRWAGAVVLVGVAAGGVLALVMLNKTEPTKPMTPPEPVAGPLTRTLEPAPAPAVAPAQAPTFVDIQIRGVPDGTEVFWPSGILGVTPARIRIPKGNDPVTITLRREGYVPVAREVTPSDTVELEVSMTPVAEPARKTRPQPERRKKRNDIEDPF